MGTETPKTGSPTLDRNSKENRWYYKDGANHLPPLSRKLLEEYSHIPPGDVDSHIYKMRDILWDHAPYPCIGEFKFLTLNLPLHPHYPTVLSLLSPTSLSPCPKFLDIGSCVAQELRALTHIGKIPSQNLYGTDINGSFLTTSYDLFKDASTFKGTLVATNIFSPNLFEAGKPFHAWEGMFTVIHTGLFLHLFSCEQQIQVCEIIVRLLANQPGALYLGEMVGCKGSGERGEGKNEKFWKEGEERKQFLHDEESFARMWDEVADLTSTRGSWKVESKFRTREKEVEGEGSKGCAFFVGEGIGWFTFSVQRT